MADTDWEKGAFSAPHTKDTDWEAGEFSEPPSRGFGGWARDIAATAVKSAIGVPELVVGLADIPTGGRVGKALQSVGFDPKAAREVANEWHSDATKEAQRKFQEADGIWEKTKTAVQNPSLIATAVGESLGPMGAGGVAARGLMALGARGVSAAAGGVGPALPGAIARTVPMMPRRLLLPALMPKPRPWLRILATA